MTSLAIPMLTETTPLRPARLLWAAAALLTLITLARLAHVLHSYAQVDQSAGVWTAMAADLARDGVFYRPLTGKLGYGGTRYFPLHFVLHAGLIRAGLGPVEAGLALAVAAGFALMAGAYQLLRRLGVAAGVAGPCAVFALATVSGQWGITTIRGDMLPAALNIWGLALCAGADERETDPSVRVRRLRLLGAAVFFLLAFAAKVTTVFGFAAAVAALLLAGRRGEALRLCLYMAFGVVLFFIAAQWASHGRFLQSLRACASSGADADTLSTSPVAMLVMTMKADPMAPIFWMLGLTALLYIPRPAWRELPSLALVATGLATLAIFGSPGIAINHLIDLHVIAVLFFVVQFARQRIPAPLGATVLAVAVMLATAGTTQTMRNGDNVDNRGRWAMGVHQLRLARGPTLCENPVLPVLAGQHAYMLDPYMFAIIGENDPAFAADLGARLDRKEFGAIVLVQDPAEKRYAEWYDIAYFGAGFRQSLLKNYRALPRAHGQDCVYVPKSEDDSVAGEPAEPL